MHALEFLLLVIFTNILMCISSILVSDLYGFYCLLQTMWEDTGTGSKWVMVNRCFFPGDLPEAVGCPCAPESNEVIFF